VLAWAHRSLPSAVVATPVCMQGGEVEIDLDEARGPIKEWILQEPVQREVRRRFARFLRTYQNADGDFVYKQRVREMARSECSTFIRGPVAGDRLLRGTAPHAGSGVQ
jgi:hypothetical protein